MMGFSSFDYRGGGGGGGGSTSNLSPLAPPFTIDQSVPKSKPNPNLSGHFTEDPYAFSYTSSHGNWVNPHTPTSLSDSFTNPTSKIDYNSGASLPSAATSSYSQSKPYYFGGQSTNTLGGTHTSTTTTTLSDSSAFRIPFSYEPLFDTVVGDTLNQVDPYYHPHYPPAVIHDKRPPSLVINRPAGSDVQPMHLGVAPLETSSQTDYTESLFGLDLNAPWAGGLWNGNNDWDQGNRKDSYGSFGWKEKNVAGSSTWKSPLKQGEKAPDDLLGYSVESLSGSSHIAPRGADLLNAKCSSTLEENARVTPFNMRPSIFGSSSVFSAVAYPHEQSPGPVMPSWSEFNPNSNSDRCFSELESCTTNPTVFYPPPAYSSPALRIRSPTNEPLRSAFNKHDTPANVKVIDRPGSICDNRQNASYMSSSSSTRHPLIHLGVEHKESFGNTNTISNELDRNDHIFVNSSPMIKDMSSSRSPITDNSLKHLLKARSDPQVNECNISDAFTSTSLANQEGDVVESSLESFDQVNTAVDSPCWKGAPTSRQSPFAVTEFVNPQIVMQELSGFKVFSVNDVASVANSSPKLHVDIVQNENGGVEYGDFISNPKLKPSHMMHSSLENDDGASAGQLATDCRVADPGIDVKSAPQDGSSSMSSTAYEQAPISPSSGVTAPTKLTEPVDEACDTMTNLLPKLDARLLVNAMHNLSELLLSACSNDIDALKEHDNEVLQNVIDNLDNLKKVGLRRPTPESQFPPSSSTSYCLRKLTDLRKGIATDKSQVRNAVANDIQSQIDATLFGKKQEVFSDIVSRSDTDSEKDNGITQALEKALKEDFHDEEDSLPQILLYKNLWLEAEAALCSMKYKAGFARMKIEMEKYKLQQEKDVAGNPINVEKSPKVSRELEPMIKEGSVANNSTEETSQSSTTPIEDVDPSVMARCRILRCRVENSSGTNREGELLSHSIDVETMAQPKEIIGNLELEETEETMKTWPYIGDRTEDREVLADGSTPPDAMLHGIHQTESERGLNQDVSRQGQEFQAYVSEMPMTNHSYMVPSRIGKMNYMARFARMKSEMVKYKLQQEKGNPINVEKSPKVSRELEPMIKEGSVANNSTEETSQSSTTLIEDVDPSVMARFRILRCRVENSSGTNREGELLSHSIDVETMAQPKEIIGNLELEETEETMKTWPYIGDRTEDREVSADGSTPPDAMLHGIHQTESERGLNQDVSRQGQEFQAYVSEMPMTNHSYMVPNRIGKQLPNGGYDMDSLSSSDWEHVLKDDFTWRN